MGRQADAVRKSGVEGLKIHIVCDNNPCEEGLETPWGFSALIAGAEKTILFDTGPGTALVNNLGQLGIEPANIDAVVLSHIHGDHTGGLRHFLEKNHKVAVYLLESFPRKLKDTIEARGAEVVEVKGPLRICDNVFSTGRVGRLLKEQALVIMTDMGTVVVTGCAHPGILRILGAARDLTGEDVAMVVGGFHLEWSTKWRIKGIIGAFKRLGVRHVGVCHCTGERARGLFKERFGSNYIDVGAGKVISVGDLG
jgi:7,8-dihydropterin-6-yl-methyl-4-(beta-D-ribofuranosyl)aminobenzene 5'-phosphate synthase